MVREMNYFVLGVVLIIIGLLASGRHPRKWRIQSNILYIAGMVMMLFAIFVLHDPIEGISAEIWGILQYVAIVGTFYGFLYMIERDMRHEVDGKLEILRTDLSKKFENLRDDIKTLKADLQRDTDRIERKLEKK